MSSLSGTRITADGSDAPAPLAHGRFWRSIEQARGLEDATEGPLDAHVAFSYGRRDFMRLMGASLALAGAAGCSRAPLEKIVPYVDGPAQQTYGRPVYYATTLARDGYGVGVLVATHMGRPSKIEGNPAHPASLGATDVFAQASVLELWDPDRSQTVRNGRTISTWNGFLAAWQSALRPVGSRGDGRLRILTEGVTSPTLHAQLVALRRRFPSARWHQWQPLNRDNAFAGARLAYGIPLETIYRFERARVVVALDADFVDAMPGCVRYAHDFAATRNARVDAAKRSRLYAIECTPTLTGAAADRRIALRGVDIVAAAHAIAHALGVPGAAATDVIPAAVLRSLVADLQGAHGGSIVAVGERQPPIVHALAHAINERLGNVGATIAHIDPAVVEPIDHAASIRELCGAMRNGDVDAVMIVGANPVYDAPSELGFADALARVPFKVHHGLYVDETAERCDWHVPAAHALESWGDARAFDGTASLQQPCIAPLYGGKSACEMIAALADNTSGHGRDLVRATWRKATARDFDAFFDDALRSGVVAASGFDEKRPPLRSGWMTDAPARPQGIELVIASDSRIADGRHANSAWLQELPKPLSELAWDNAALISPALALRLGIESEDVVELRVADRSIEAPAWVMPGMPDGSVTLALGYGRSAAGKVGNGRGSNAYALRTSDMLWLVPDVAIARTGRRYPLACRQLHGSMQGRDIVRSYTVAEAAACERATCSTEPPASQPTLYDSPPSGPYAWAMSIDLSACIGCGACTIACQAENNIPVVGKDEVRKGREMHWIRVDRYYEGPLDDPRVVFQPVPCMQCEHAPCEVVCPVEASVHDAQGINVQVYNRCVGTRFCSNNCPYKVRRFNFFAYAKDVPGLDAQRNPDVTVRMRGVMEKCNYCLQRITTAKIAADREGRRLADGDVVTACQAVCPTRAIAFGDLNDPQSEVNHRKRSPLDYALLAELNTRPRTTYLAKVTNAG